MTSQRKGFTLIELLVVIAIIAILAAMLFPVFARARESARKIQCLSNVKNIAIALQMYLTDYDRFPPNEHNAAALEYFDTAPGGGSFSSYTGHCNRVAFANPYLRWPVILDEYTKNRDIWRCPSAQYDTTANWIVGAPGGNYIAWLRDHEGMWGRANSNCDTSGGGGPCCVGWPPGWGGAVTDSITQMRLAAEDPNVFVENIGTTSHPAPSFSFGPQNCDLKTSQIEDASWFVVCGDSLWNDTEYPSAMAYPEICGTIAICEGGCCEEPDFWYDAEVRRQYTRHLGGSNLGFADGHASWFPAEAIMSNVPSAANLTGGKIRGMGGQLYPWEWLGYCP